MHSFRAALSARHLLFFLCTLSTLLLLLAPAPAMEAVREALRLCTETIIPSLFPFLVLSSLLTALLPQSAANRLFSPLMQRLFRLGGSSAAVLALGFTGGYPVGVRTAAELYQKGALRREEALHLLAFCNNSGPGFLLGVVGIGVFQSTKAGLLLYAVHILAALLVGFLFRFSHAVVTKSPPPSESAAQAFSLSRLFTESVTGAFSAVLNICAFVLFFMIFLRMLSFSGALHLLSAALAALMSPLGMTESCATALIAGFLELSTGSARLQGAALTPLTAALVSFLLGWGGLSVHCQSLLFLQSAALPCRTYFLGKFLQGIFAALLAALLFSLPFAM